MTQYSLAQLTVLWASPPELVRLAASAGYDFVGLRLLEVTGGDAWPLATDPQLMRETKAAMEGYGVGVLDVELIRLSPDLNPPDVIPALEAAAQLGARHVIVQAHDSDWNRLIENFAAVCDLANKFGLTADVEFLTWTDMRDLASVVRLIEAVDRPNAGIMIDTLHFSRSNCEPEDLKRIDPRLFRFMQICDAPAVSPTTREGLIFAAREDRQNPGDGDLNLSAILTALPPDIPVAVEIPNTRFASAMSDEDRVREALDRTRAVVQQVDLARRQTFPLR